MKNSVYHPRAMVVAGVLLTTANAFADEGVLLIDQARAMAGGVTPGDEPGWPIRIRQSGTYRLTSDLVVAAPQSAGSVIAVEADDVTIDLNGFGIHGPNRCKANNVGMLSCSAVVDYAYGISSHRSFTKVRNGRINGMGSTGIWLGTLPDHKGGLIENVDLTHNGRMGALVVGGSVRNSSSRFNGGEGFVVGWNSTITGSQAEGNRGPGIELRVGGALANGNIATGNGQGILATTGSGYGGNVLFNNKLSNASGAGTDLGGNLK